MHFVVVLCWIPFSRSHLGTVYKGRPPEGGEGGLKIVDENGHGGRGVLEEWMSVFQDLPKYNCDQNVTYLKSKWSCYQAEQCKW